jgi:hypothetical protein
VGDGATILRRLCELGTEGIIAKRADRPYRSGTRSGDWLKIKCLTEGEFVVIGYTLSDSPGRPFASLLLATRESDGTLRHVGRVGTGWDDREMVRIAKLLQPLRTDTAPVDRVLPGQVRREIRWVNPKLVAQVGYAEITRDGALRHPRYIGLREDKTAHEVLVREIEIEAAPHISLVTACSREKLANAPLHFLRLRGAPHLRSLIAEVGSCVRPAGNAGGEQHLDLRPFATHPLRQPEAASTAVNGHVGEYHIYGKSGDA